MKRAEPKQTLVGFGVSSTTLEDIIPDAPPVSPIEVVFDRVTVAARSQNDAAPFQMLEIWTQNRVYLVDSKLTCVEVRDRATGLPDGKHRVLGARLAGGQRRYGKTMHQSRPFPVPGTEAVFDTTGPSGRPEPAKVTSQVERVVLHIRVTTIVLEHDNAWDDVTNALLHPGPGRVRDE